MKNKTKGLIALIAMTAAAAAAAGSSTFAWFQTNRSAELSFNKITIAKRGANELKAELISLGLDTLAADKQSLTVANAADAEASDISSKDGVQLYAPVWGNKVGDAEKVSKVDTVIDSSNSKANKWFTEFAFQVTNEKKGSDTTKLNVFLDDRTLLSAVEVAGYDDAVALLAEYAADSTSHTASEVEDAQDTVAQHDANEAAALWSRVAIISVSEKPGSHAAVGLGKLSQTGVLTFENEATGTGNNSEQFINSVTVNPSTDLMDIGTYTTERHYYTFDDPENYYDDTHVEYASMSAAGKAGYLTTLDPNQTNYYIVRVWLEGTENDNQEIADGGEIELNLGFTSYGIDA